MALVGLLAFGVACISILMGADEVYARRPVRSHSIIAGAALGSVFFSGTFFVMLRSILVDLGVAPILFARARGGRVRLGTLFRLATGRLIEASVGDRAVVMVPPPEVTNVAKIRTEVFPCEISLPGGQTAFRLGQPLDTMQRAQLVAWLESLGLIVTVVESATVA